MRYFLLAKAVAGLSLLMAGAVDAAAPPDVLCDGSDATAALQAAVDAGRPVVALSPGVCLVTGIDLRSGLHLRGAGTEATTLRLADGSDTHVLAGVDVTDIAITDLTIDANGDANAAGHGIRFADSRRIRLQRLVIERPAGYGLGFQRGAHRDLLVEDVWIRQPGADGIDFKNPEAGNRRIVLSRVRVDEPGDRKAGIDLRGERFVLRDIVVTGVGFGDVGIRFRQTGGRWGPGGHLSELHGFRVSGTGGIGVHIVDHGNRVTRGEIYGTAVGVQVTSTPTSEATDNLVVGVKCVACRIAGFRTRAQAGADPVQRTRFLGCRSHDSERDGMEIATDANFIGGCHVTGSAEVGIEITASADGTVLAGNRLENNGIDYVNDGTGTRRLGP